MVAKWQILLVAACALWTLPVESMLRVVVAQFAYLNIAFLGKRQLNHLHICGHPNCTSVTSGGDGLLYVQHAARQWQRLLNAANLILKFSNYFTRFG